MNKVLILLGSNKDASSTLPRGVKMLEELLNKPFFVSEILVSQAVHADGTPSMKPDYLNALCWGETNLEIEMLNVHFKKMEMEAGRVRGPESHGLVALDIDLVVWNQTLLRPVDVVQTYFRDCLRSLIIQNDSIDWKKELLEFPGIEFTSQI